MSQGASPLAPPSEEPPPAVPPPAPVPAPALAMQVEGERTILAGRPDGEPTTRFEVNAREALEIWGPLDESILPVLAQLGRKISSSEASVSQLAGALVEANDQLIAVYDLARVQTGSLEDSEAVVKLLDEGCRLLKSDYAVLSDGGSRTYRSGSTPASREAAEGTLDWLDSCIQSYLETDTPAIVDDGHGTSALLVDVVGPDGGSFVLAMSRRRDGRYLTGDRRLVEAIADRLVGVLTTSALHRQALVRNEHDTAAQLAQSVLPQHQPNMSMLDAVARTYPARSAGGDFFTYANGDEAFHFVVGDVSGKGLPAAIVMSTLVSSANAALRRHGADGPIEVMRAIDDDSYDYLSDSGLFATMVVGSIWPKQGLAEFVNAGHGPVLFGNADTVAQIDACAPPVGVLPLGDVEVTTCLLSPGELVVIGSDGLTEQENTTGEMFGEDQLGDLVQRCAGMSSDSVSQSVLEAVGAFAAAAPQSDDRTIMVMQVMEENE